MTPPEKRSERPIAGALLNPAISTEIGDSLPPRDALRERAGSAIGNGVAAKRSPIAVDAGHQRAPAGGRYRGATAMNTGVIDRFTEVFTRYIDSGFGLLGGEVAFLASTLIVIDVTLAGLFWAWGADEDVLAHLVKKMPEADLCLL